MDGLQWRRDENDERRCERQTRTGAVKRHVLRGHRAAVGLAVPGGVPALDLHPGADPRADRYLG